MSVTGVVLERVSASETQASFVSEVVASLATTHGLLAVDVELALSILMASGDVQIARHPAPDPHLSDVDLRIVAISRTEAERASAHPRADSLWDEFLKTFLASHRCG